MKEENIETIEGKKKNKTFFLLGKVNVGTITLPKDKGLF